MSNLKQTLQALFTTATDNTLETLRIDDSLSPNMRALRLSVEIADTLVAMGVSTADVVSMALDITDRYCRRKVQFDISSTLITASQDRGNEREPLTLVRHATARTVNNMTVQSLQELVRDIQQGNLKLNEAEERLDHIRNNPRGYPRIITVGGGALISVGAGMLFNASPLILTIMFLLGAGVTYAMRYLGHLRFPAFFIQIFAAMLITLVAAGVTWLDLSSNVTWISNINPTLIVIGGIMMLLAGLTTVAAVQDAIDEFYVTANARLLKVIMMTIAIVAGVLAGIYIAKKLGVAIQVDAAQATRRADWQILGAILISAGYALNMQTKPLGVIISGGLGALSIGVYAITADVSNLSIIVATGVAAVAVGATATLFSRIWRTPSAALMTAGIVPLVPGLSLYNGLFDLVGTSTSVNTFDNGIFTLFNTILIALAIASGVSLGHLLARPVRRTLVRARNVLPIPKVADN